MMAEKQAEPEYPKLETVAERTPRPHTTACYSCRLPIVAGRDMKIRKLQMTAEDPPMHVYECADRGPQCVDWEERQPEAVHTRHLQLDSLLTAIEAKGTHAELQALAAEIRETFGGA